MSNAIMTYTDAIMDAESTFAAIDDCPVDYEREKYFALQICERSSALQNRNILPSLAHAVRNVALCGITLNPAMKLAYIVPRGGMACLDISYMGLIKIATDSGSVSSVSCNLVYQNDVFKVIHGTDENLRHEPLSFGDRGDVMGVYTIARLHNGSMLVETMSMDEVLDIKKRSKARNGPWVTDFNEMMRKTCVKRASKYWPKTERLGEAIHSLNEHEGFEPLQSPATEAAEKVRNEEVSDADIEKRMALVASLELIALNEGLPGYAAAWKDLTTDERKLIGASEHERIKGLAADQAEEAEIVSDDSTPFDDEPESSND